MRFLCLFIALGTSVFSGSVYAATTDTLDINENLSMIQKVQRTSAYQITKQGVPLLFASALATTIDKRIQETRQANMSSFSYHFDDYLQYAPMAAMFGMKLAGVKGRSNWGEMMTADVFSAALMAGVVNGLKYTVKRDRPNHSKNNSFPSGHTATAFMAATMLYKEYKDLSPWVGIGAYSAATLVAAGRMMNNRHWLSDVLAGAGIGIMSTEVGYILSDLIFRKETGVRPARRRCILFPDSLFHRVFHRVQFFVSTQNKLKRKRTDVLPGIEYHHLGSLLPAERLGNQPAGNYSVGQADPG